MDYLTGPLDGSHKRSSFHCGKESLDNYLHRQARQDMRRRLAVVFVTCNSDNDVIGFYSLSNDGLPIDEVPSAAQKTMPRAYERLPITLLGRLAVDAEHQGQGLGEKLLIDAMRRCYDLSRSEIGSAAIVVDPLDEAAAEFYAGYGFAPIPDRGRMFIPMKTVGSLFAEK